jgi:hypothetical protein
VKALLNAHLSGRLSERLRSEGLDVEAIVERDDLDDSMSDARVFDTASSEGRAVVTNNVKDFRPIAARRLQVGASHAGLILVPSTVPRALAATGRLAELIGSAMAANPHGLADREIWLIDRT